MLCYAMLFYALLCLLCYAMLYYVVLVLELVLSLGCATWQEVFTGLSTEAPLSFMYQGRALCRTERSKVMGSC
jgi:hypothetical protein